MHNFPPELTAVAKTAKSARELLELAKDNNVELTEEQAETYFEKLNANRAMSDDELDAVAGGIRFLDDVEECKMFPDNARVNTIDGSACPSCGSTQGYIAYCSTGVRQSGNRMVKCLKCDKVIQNTFDKNKVHLC